MHKKSFWSGFATGIVATGLSLFLILRGLVVQPDLTLGKMQLEDLSGNK